MNTTTHPTVRRVATALALLTVLTATSCDSSPNCDPGHISRRMTASQLVDAGYLAPSDGFVDNGDGTGVAKVAPGLYVVCGVPR